MVNQSFRVFSPVTLIPAPPGDAIETIARREHISTLLNVKNDKMLSLLHPMDQIVHFLLPPRDAEMYTEKLPGEQFRFYVYTNLPHPYSWQGVSESMETIPRCRSNLDNMTRDEFVAEFCDWASSVCNPRNHTHNCQYNKARNNRNGDTVLSKLFTEYHGPMRTYNAEEAHLYVVPFPAAGWACASHMANPKVALNWTFFQAEILDRLEFFNSTTKYSHVFLYSFEQPQQTPLINLPLVASISVRKRTGHVVIPYVNTHSEYQPSYLKQRRVDRDAFYSQKNISMAVVMASRISGNGAIRQAFIDRADEWFNGEIGGLPVSITNIQEKRKLPNEVETMKLYRQSIFCPCLRGDEPNQKRFFDVILSGCIPVVMSYASGQNSTTYFAPGAYPIEKFLPLAQKAFAGAPTMGLNYSDVVIEIDGKCGPACMKGNLEALLKDPVRLRHKQARLDQVARLFSFGMGQDAFQHVDAVTALLVQARHASVVMKIFKIAKNTVG